MRDLNLFSLRVFADVVALGSLSAAAERHGITQPAVSHHLRQLESRFGVALVERQGRRTVPTVAGAELVRQASRIEAAVAQTQSAMSRFVPGTMGRLRIGAGATACMVLLPPVLRWLRDEMPALDVSVMTGNSPDIVRALDDDRIDAGVVTVPVSGRLLQVETLFEDEIVLLAPEAMGLPATVKPVALLDHLPMLFEPEGVTRSLIDAWFAREGIAFQPGMSLGSVEAVRSLVAMGVGCALFPRMVLAGWTMEPGSVVHRLEPPLRRTLGCVTRSDRAKGAGLEAFLAAVRLECARHAG